MKKQSGITLVGAIFLLVIVSLLGIYLVNITGVQRQTTIMALQSARAYQAANAGIEWGVERIVNATNCAASTTLSPNINNFTVQVSCSLLGSYSEGLNTVNVYQLTAQSEYGSYGDPSYVSRTLQAIINE
jgi:MSHA biogenesis protein MshP